MNVETSGLTQRDDNLKSLVKIMRILESFSTMRRALSLGELCQQCGFPKSTTHRLIASMREVGLLDQDREGERYRLGLKLFELGNIVLANMDLHREAQSFVDALTRISGQGVHLAVFDGRLAVVIRRTDPIPEGGNPANLIESAPAHCTSVGKAILAYQDAVTIDRVIAGGLARFTDQTIVNPTALRSALGRVRRLGHAIDEGEHQPGVRCVGAPIRDQNGRVFAAISVSGPAWRLPASEVESLAKIVIHHANGISASLGYRVDPG